MAQIAQGLPRLALLDFNLGKDTTSIPVGLKLNEHEVPIIFLSGYTHTTVEIPEALSNASRLAKPFQSAELVAKVQSVLEDA